MPGNGWPKSADILRLEGWKPHDWGECRICRARILWALTPIEINLYGEQTGGGKLMPLREVSAPEGGPPGRYFASHFADCPNANQHRRAGR